MRKYKRLTYSDRQEMEKMTKVGSNPTQIATAIGISVPTVYRELKRGRATAQNIGSYSADAAQLRLGTKE